MPQLTITEVRNVKSSSSDNSTYSLEINHPVDGWIPYKINAPKEDTTIDEDKLLATIGTDFSAYVAPTQAELDAELSESLRLKRDKKLVEEVDPIVSNPLRWAELTDAKQAEWTQYRTDLLNLPEQSGFPNDITWPTKPT
jgi:hypothetical protein